MRALATGSAVIERVVLTPTFIETGLDRVFMPDDVDRSALEAEKQDLEGQIRNLTQAVKLARDPNVVVSLIEEMETVNARLAPVKRYLEPREAADRAQLREALTRRVEDWKSIVRLHPVQARQVLHHLLDGPIQIRRSDGADLQALVDAGIDLNDQSGKEDITPEDCRLDEKAFREVAGSMRQIAGERVWTATTKPAGLLAGLPGSERMASPMPASWNQIAGWLKQIDSLRHAA